MESAREHIVQYAPDFIVANCVGEHFVALQRMSYNQRSQKLPFKYFVFRLANTSEPI